MKALHRTGRNRSPGNERRLDEESSVWIPQLRRSKAITPRLRPDRPNPNSIRPHIGHTAVSHFYIFFLQG